MKVALCLSGQIRSIDLTIEKIISNVIIPNNCDVFCHTWHEYHNSKYVNYYNPSDNEVVRYGSYSFENIEKVIRQLKPISFSFESPFIPQNTKSMFYSLMKSNHLKTQYEKMMNFEYDVVIRSRYDLLFYNQLNLNEIVDNVIYLSSRPGGCGGVNDCFAYANSKTMNLYSNIFDEYKDTVRITELCPEGIVYESLRSKNIHIQNPPNTFTLIREDGQEIPIN